MAKAVVSALKKAEPALDGARRGLMKSIAVRDVEPQLIKKKCVEAVQMMTIHLEHLKTAQRLLA